MFIVSTLQGAMGLVRAALAALLLVWVPLADAATCTADKLDSHSVISASLDAATDAGQVSDVVSNQTNDNSSVPVDTQHCVHGHCHQPLAPQSIAETPDLVVMTEAATSREPTRALARVETGLERPPKI